MDVLWGVRSRSNYRAQRPVPVHPVGRYSAPSLSQPLPAPAAKWQLGSLIRRVTFQRTPEAPCLYGRTPEGQRKAIPMASENSLPPVT